MNIYKQILQDNVNKLLSLYNTDKFSKTYGYGDREFWGWKTKDFNNATLQGGVHTLAIALKLNIFDKEQKDYILEIINSAILAVKNIRAKNGSVVEAYPQENSFCVTALVAFDILSAIKYLETTFTQEQKDRYFDIIKPLIEFISKENEEHAIISNHIATASAAITLWNSLTNEINYRDKELLQIIYNHQSSEGWYKEYEGADQGYQTLCTYYLFCIYEITKDEKLLSSLKKSAKFLSYFIHPDGTIGGLYGSRNTEVYYPAGIIGLSNNIEEFAFIAKYLYPKEQHILPQHIDIGNYIPLLNSYAVAAINYEENKELINSSNITPFYEKNKSINFHKAGLYIHSNKSYFAIINYKKGGTLKIFNKKTKLLDTEDGGLFGILDNGIKFSTQQYDDNIEFTNKKIKSNFYKINESYPNPINFIILRVLSLSAFKSTYLGNLFKKLIVNMLMTGKNRINISVNRDFKFLEEKIIINENINSLRTYKEIKHIGKSKSIHMASSGYFINQQYNNKKSLVEFNLEISNYNDR